MGADASGDATLASALRTYRRAAGLSQERLAELAAVSVRTVRNIESGRVLAPRLASVWALAEGLGIDGQEREQFHELGLVVAIPDPGPFVPAPLTPLVGRMRDVAALGELLAARTARLITLTGVAGVGKSRLAIELGTRLRHAGERTWWVPLASVGDARYVLDAVAAAVGSPVVSTDAVVERIRRQPAVLVLDNLEHLDGVGAVLVDLLARAPATRVLATSRRPIRASGEHEWIVGPLDVPDADIVDPVAMMAVGSVQLLVERIRSTMPGFVLTPANCGVVGELCRLLDGLPLAMELAAKQWRVRGGAGLARIVQRDPLALRDVDSSVSPEHASLRSALEASAALLGEGELRTFGALSVLAADWDIDAAVATAGGGTVVEDVDRLVAFGLITRLDGDGHGTPRFSMLPTIRAFAADQASDGARSVAEACRAEYFRGWVQGAAGDDGVHDSMLERERDNLRGALDWLVSSAPHHALEMAMLLHPHWRRRGRDEEGLAYLRDLLAKVDDDDLAPRAQEQAAMLAHVIGHRHLASQLAAQSLAGFRRQHDDHGSARALGTLGMIACVSDPSGAAGHCQAAVTMAERLDDPYLLSWLLERLAVALAQVGRLEEAIAAIDRSAAVATEHGLTSRQLQALVKRAMFLYAADEIAAADRLLDDIKPLVAAADDAFDQAAWLAIRAAASAGLGDTARAEALVVTSTGRARHYGSTLLSDMADWANAEVQLLGGNRVDAVALLRPAVVNQRPLGLPLNRIMVLAALAVAATDVHTAALAVAAAQELCHRYDMELPALPARRVSAARQRWVSAAGSETWAACLAAASVRPLDDLIHGLAAAQ